MSRHDTLAKAEMPAPVPNAHTPIIDMLIDDIQRRWGAGPEVLQVLDVLAARRAEGIAKYGTPLQPYNGRPAARDFMQEMVDATLYAMQCELEGLHPIYGYWARALTLMMMESVGVATMLKEAQDEPAL